MKNNDDKQQISIDGVIIDIVPNPEYFGIGFSLPAGKAEIQDGIRVIEEINLREISIVSDPDNTNQ